jgi:O-antigen/teichoic acid export membrane protein
VSTSLIGRLAAPKLARDIAWSLGGFAFLAISGIVINVVLASARDAAALGVFNLAYAVYIVASQVATLGLHYSVLRYSALHAQDRPRLLEMFSTAAVLTLALGVTAAVVVLALAEPLGDLFDSPRAGRALGNAAPGLALFSLNKVLLSFLNGLRMMRAHALLQSGRYFTIMVMVALVAFSDWPIEYATLSFLAAEVVTTIAAFAFLSRQQLTPRLRIARDWLREHLRFGFRGLAAGLFAEFNSRIDVLMIGIFLPDREVGIYSFAAMLVDGMYHVLTMVRLNFNPLLVAALRDSDREGAVRLRKRSGPWLVAATLAMSLGIIALLWLLAGYIIPGKGLAEGIVPLGILCTGLVAIAFLVPFDNLLLVTGHPGYQTLQQFTTVAANVTLCLLLIPVLGIAGAAIGTSVSYVAGISALVLLSRRVLGWRLITNRFER